MSQDTSSGMMIQNKRIRTPLLSLVFLCIMSAVVCLDAGHDLPKPLQPRNENRETSLPDTIRSIICEVRFVENNGRYPPQVRYTAAFANGCVFFCDREIVYSYRQSRETGRTRSQCGNNEKRFSRKAETESRTRGFRTVSYSVRYAGSRPACTPAGLHPRSELTRVISGRNPALHTVASKTYDTLVYRNVYTGVDLYFYNNAGRLKSEYRMRDPRSYSRIELVYRRVRSLSVREDGALSVSTGGTACIEEAPTSFQDSGALRASVPVAYYVSSGHRLRFRIGKLHDDMPLVIDPVFSSLFGGTGYEGGIGIIHPSSEEICVGGVTSSMDFPIVDGRIQEISKGRDEGFIMRIDTRQWRIIASTYFGGSDDDIIKRIGSLQDGRIVISGDSYSTDLPVTANAFRRVPSGNQDCFIAVLDAHLSSLQYSTYLGGSGFDDLFDMTIDRNDNICITGLTDSRDYPVTQKAFQKAYGGGEDDVFVTKLRTSDYSLAFSTYIGGYDYDEGYTIVTDTAMNVYVGGLANSRNYPVTADAFQSQPNSIDQGFVSILDSTGSTYIYGTYIGGSRNDRVQDLAFDRSGSLIILGLTTSLDLRTTPEVFQPRLARPDSIMLDEDGFVLKLDPTRKHAVWWTYLGGTDLDDPRVLMMYNNTPVIAGISKSVDYPVFHPLRRNNSGKYDIVLSILDDNATSLLFGTYYGGNDIDAVNAALLYYPFIAITGFTLSTDYPTTTNALKDSLEGVDDAFITVFDLRELLNPSYIVPGSAPGSLGMPRIAPNPSSGQGASISITSKSDQTVEISIYNSRGKLVFDTRVYPSSDGNCLIRHVGWNLPPGVYFCNARSGRESRTVKMVRM
jgi:hypothetical protein